MKHCRTIMHHTRTLAIGDNEWCEQVKHKLLDGLGVEDIALWLRCHPSHVRTEVGRLRRLGFLARWWGRK